MLVRILKHYTLPRWPSQLDTTKRHPGIMRQTPGCKGIWDGVRFALDPVEKCDYAIVLDYIAQDTTVNCPPGHLWVLRQEAPTKELLYLHKSDDVYDRVYTQHLDLRGQRYIYTQPAIPWEVDRDYDFLIKCGVPEKRGRLSSVTSNKSWWEGHRARLQFIKNIRKEVDFDLFGEGVDFLADKWDGLAPYKYSIAIENHSNPHWWTEKIADCFLAWTMPIYYGCTGITKFFPPESLVYIDINDPAAPKKIKEVIESDLWERNIDAIAHARELVLNKYQVFPFIADEIKKDESNHASQNLKYRAVRIPSQLKKDPLHPAPDPAR